MHLKKLCCCEFIRDNARSVIEGVCEGSKVVGIRDGVIEGVLVGTDVTNATQQNNIK